MQSPKIRIRLRAFDYRAIDRSSQEIVETAKPDSVADPH